MKVGVNANSPIANIRFIGSHPFEPGWSLTWGISVRAQAVDQGNRDCAAAWSEIISQGDRVLDPVAARRFNSAVTLVVLAGLDLRLRFPAVARRERPRRPLPLDPHHRERPQNVSTIAVDSERFRETAVNKTDPRNRRRFNAPKPEVARHHHVRNKPCSEFESLPSQPHLLLGQHLRRANFHLESLPHYLVPR